MEGFWRVGKAGGTAVWREWKWCWNAVRWGSKSYFEVTCGATKVVEVCRSSAISCPSFDRQPSAARPSAAPQNPSLHPPFPRCRRRTNNNDTRTLRSATLCSTLPRRPHHHRVDALSIRTDSVCQLEIIAHIDRHAHTHKQINK